jgi:hypothetical protein
MTAGPAREAISERPSYGVVLLSIAIAHARRLKRPLGVLVSRLALAVALTLAASLLAPILANDAGPVDVERMKPGPSWSLPVASCRRLGHPHM